MAEEDEDLDAKGLIGHSYDSLFGIVKRIRKINDLEIPLRNGVTTNQVGVFVGTFVLCVILLALVINPIFNFLYGLVPPAGQRFLLLGRIACLVVPPIMAANRVTKPMPDGKTIPGWIVSWLRFQLDDPVHRRGVPIADSGRPVDEPVLHYQREFVMTPEFQHMAPGEGDYSDPQTEKRMRAHEVIDLQPWLDERALEHLRAEADAREAARDEDNTVIHAGRATTTRVVVPDLDDGEDDR